MADKIKFSKGLSSAMGNVAKNTGQFLLQTDTGNLFVDLSSTSRLQVKDSTKLPLSGGTLTGKLTAPNFFSEEAFIVSDPDGNLHGVLSPLEDGTKFECPGGSFINLRAGGITVGNTQYPLERVKIYGVADGDDDSAAVNKSQLDAVTARIGKIEGGTTELPYLKKSGGTMTGAINMGSKKITSLATPTDSTDAATKDYVDTVAGGQIDPSTFATKDDLNKKLDKTGGSGMANFAILCADGGDVDLQGNYVSLTADTYISMDAPEVQVPIATTTGETLQAVNIQYLLNNFGSKTGIDDGVLA